MSTAAKCDCVARMDESLKPHGLRLASCFSLGASFSTVHHRPVLITTEKLPDAGRRKNSPPLVMATFCPFCGKRFVEPESAKVPQAIAETAQ